MASLSAISVASKDEDLIDRFVSAAAAIGVENPQTWVHVNMRTLVTKPISSGISETIADVYTYARETRPPAPGANPSAVLDDYILYAVAQLNT